MGLIYMGHHSSPFTKKIHSGISIHSHAVRGVMANEKGSIIGFSEVLFDQPILTDDIPDPKPLINAFLQIKQKAHFTSPYVALCFPEKYAFSRQYLLPKINLSEVNEAINWQIEKIFPFTKKEIYFDWKILEHDKDHTLVLVTAVPKKLLDHLRICLEQAGLFPISFEPSALAIGRILPEKETGTAIILEVDNNSACTTLVINRTSVVTSTHNLVSANSLDQAFSLVRSSIYTMIKKYVPQELTPPQSIKIFLTGEKASASLAQSLGAFFQLPVEPLAVSNVTPAYHLSYIAAKSKILPPGSDQSVNLLPTALQELYTQGLNKEQAAKSFKTTLALTLPALIICLFTYLLTQVFLSTLSKAVVNAQAATAIPNLAGLNLAVLNQESQAYINLFPLKVSPENTLYQIMSHLPENITVTGLTFDTKTRTYTLNGLARDRVDLIELKNALEALNLFTEVALPLSSLENLERVNFSLVLTEK